MLQIYIKLEEPAKKIEPAASVETYTIHSVVQHAYPLIEPRFSDKKISSFFHQKIEFQFLGEPIFFRVTHPPFPAFFAHPSRYVQFSKVSRRFLGPFFLLGARFFGGRISMLHFAAGPFL